MLFKRWVILSLILGLFACGGGGEGGNPLDGGVDDQNRAGFSEENFVAAANSIEILELPMAFSNFVVSVLHDLEASPGISTKECLFNSSGTGRYNAELSNNQLEIELLACDIEGVGQVSGTMNVAFSSLQKIDNYLDFNAILDIPQLDYVYEGQAFQLGFSASIAQALSAEHQITQSVSLVNNQAIYFNTVPFYFKNSQITKLLDYTTGQYVVSFAADFSLPSAFDGEIKLSTSTPISGQINQYPESGRFLVSGGFGDYISMRPDPFDSTSAQVDLEVSGQHETEAVLWDTIISGSAVAFPARQGLSSGGWSNSGYFGDAGHWYYENQSPVVKSSANNALQPSITFLVMPTPEEEDLLNIEVFNSYESVNVPSDHYRVIADGPWITLEFIEDLAVDCSYMVMFYAEDGNHFVTYSFDTNMVFDVAITADQFIAADDGFVLGPVSSSNDELNYSIEWTLLGGGSISVDQFDATHAQIDTTEMQAGKNYTFQATIVDPYSRVTTKTVTLAVETDTGERSYLELAVGPNYDSLPSRTLLYLLDSSGEVSEERMFIQGSQQLLLSAYPFINGSADTRDHGASIGFFVDDHYWAYNCADKSIQATVLENVMVNIGTNEYGAPIEYQKLAIDFELECDGAYMSGKLRNRSTIH